MRAFELFSRHRAADAQRMLQRKAVTGRSDRREICSGCEGTLLPFLLLSRVIRALPSR